MAENTSVNDFTIFLSLCSFSPRFHLQYLYPPPPSLLLLNFPVPVLFSLILSSCLILVILSVPLPTLPSLHLLSLSFSTLPSIHILPSFQSSPLPPLNPRLPFPYHSATLFHCIICSLHIAFSDHIQALALRTKSLYTSSLSGKSRRGQREMVKEQRLGGEQECKSEGG